MASKLLKFGVPVVRGATVRHQTGTCGIEPFKPEPIKPPPPPAELPSHLLRPPCSPSVPDQKLGRSPPDCKSGMKGYFCPVTRTKYRYPPFSENIDFVPTGGQECWWATPRQCEVEDLDESLLVKN